VTRNESVTDLVPTENRHNKKAGMPAFEPTDWHREVVRRAAGFGLPHDYICQCIVNPRTGQPIARDTLEKHFRTELDHGKNFANHMVINTLFEKAVNGDTTAGIWWTKTQCGWRETQQVEVSNKFDHMSEKGTH
jgi:hypothetical protein